MHTGRQKLASALPYDLRGKWPEGSPERLVALGPRHFHRQPDIGEQLGLVLQEAPQFVPATDAPAPGRENSLAVGSLRRSIQEKI
jgi:hypothetical protein